MVKHYGLLYLYFNVKLETLTVLVTPVEMISGRIT